MIFAAAPLIVDHTTSLVIRLGHKATFYCTVDGMPTPSVSWVYNGSNIDFSSNRYSVKRDGQNHTLTIDPVLERDAGEYKCTASNAYGSLSTPAKLEVKDSGGE